MQKNDKILVIMDRHAPGQCIIDIHSRVFSRFNLDQTRIYSYPEGGGRGLWHEREHVFLPDQLEDAREMAADFGLQKKQAAIHSAEHALRGAQSMNVKISLLGRDQATNIA